MSYDPSTRGALTLLALVYLVLWPLTAALVHHSPPLDMIEGFVWGLHPQAGYYKHPPLPAWVISASTALFGKHTLALLVLGPLCTWAALAVLWWLARQLMDERLAVVSVFLASTQFYFNLLIPEFNHNVVQIPLWAASLALFWTATRSGGLLWFIALGLSLGLCLLAKYSATLLYLFMLFWLAVDAESRRNLSLGKVAACVAAALLVAAPNLIWLVQHDFQSLNYVQERLGERLSVAGRLAAAAQFLGAQLGINLVMLVLAWRLLRPAAGQGDAPPSPAARFLLGSVLLPVLASLAVPLIGGRPLRDMWGMMMFTTLALALVCWRPEAFRRLYSRRWMFAWLIFQGATLLIYAGNVMIKTRVTHSLSRANFPGPELAALIESDWNAKTGNAPFRYVVGSTWAAGNVAFFSRATPDVLINGDFGISPWVDQQRLQACGYVLLWAPEKQGRETGPWMAALNPGLPENAAVVRHAGQPALSVPAQWVVVPPTADCPKT